MIRKYELFLLIPFQVVLRLVPRLDLSEFTGGRFSASKVRPSQKFFDPSKFPEGRVERRNNAKLGRCWKWN